MKTKRAAFLDRDGVINEERPYIFRWEDFDYIPRSLDALRRLTDDPDTLVIVATGQSGIGRGKYSEADFHLLANKMRNDLLREKVIIDGIWYCPHLPAGERHRALHPYNAVCNCRKPLTGMIDDAIDYYAKQGFEIDLGSSCVIGDKTADVKLAENAGCQGILVKTGYGGQEKRDRYEIKPHFVAEDLYDAVDWWLR